MQNLKPFDLQSALAGKAVMLRNGEKAYVRHHETELDVNSDDRLLGYTERGTPWSWHIDGRSNTVGRETGKDIIGMYPETRTINGFEVPLPEISPPEYGGIYYTPRIDHKKLFALVHWCDGKYDRLVLERGLVFLSEEDAIATTKAILGIDPYSKGES